MHILLTGAAGFTGQGIAQVLCPQHDVRGLDLANAGVSVIAFLRKAPGDGAPVLVVCNFTPVPRTNYLVGVPSRGVWREILNTDAREYGGSGWGNLGSVESVPITTQGRLESVNLNLPPLATIMLRFEPRG